VLAALGRGSAQMPPLLERMLNSAADLEGAPCSQSDFAVYPELQIDRAYRRSLMPCMQMHAHLQAAALRCYPGRKLLSPAAEKYHAYQTQRNEYERSIDIRTWYRETGAEPEFDLAQVWMLHSPTSYAAA
jgi:hypothetical protein